MGGTLDNTTGTSASVGQSAEEIELEKERRAREKKLQDLRLQMLRRRGSGTPGLQPEPNQQQTLG